MNAYSTGSGSHSNLVSPLAGLNLDAFDAGRAGYTYGQYGNIDTTYLYQRPQYIFSNPAYPGYGYPHKLPPALPEYSLNWSWPWAPAMNPYTDPLPQVAYNPFVLQHMEFPASPTDTIASDLSPSPAPQRVPLLAPKPLPYHSPKFLQFELPDEDEDLSHPPYIRPSKRKRVDEDEDAQEQGRMKRRASEDVSATSTWSGHGPSGQFAPRRQSMPQLAASARRRR
ncbi:hypothetical protein GLOTRDRAFT_110178 [Gloeophyllum trabeum ATCC 11539]|uniref:Uncharacterized protein n=1 Tax=Gloeophyllum trabeum (strain ATCC 11539 / FP-39264 / Madison 617) TaxID=670483 RepID=S7QGQ3_GLOTA|nr:uncharacterized protein GLOTRDRAFT_110178 [Gloeophyllum trabeum ATCC 11539]EPQ58398.1 hypothetical protein GLOTRDRAFT_110178 [Gloeophyllum trabeum ATCC 11539]